MPFYNWTVRIVQNSVEKVGLPESRETLFRYIVSAWNFDSAVHIKGFDSVD
jgi:hypothetical protein